MTEPQIGDIVLYRTDGRNGLAYELPAIVTCVRNSHPGDYPDGRHNPCPVPSSVTHAHLTVFTPGGLGTEIVGPAGVKRPQDDTEFVGASSMIPGSGTYVELDVPLCPDDDVVLRSWRPIPTRP